MALNVYLYRVGRNLNRTYRTCEAFGVTELRLIECDAKLAGNLYLAKGRVNVSCASGMPHAQGLLALETWAKTPIWGVDWSKVASIIIGGESSGLPLATKAEQFATIPMFGMVSGLTVEASLAIALHEWRRSC